MKKLYQELSGVPCSGKSYWCTNKKVLNTQQKGITPSFIQNIHYISLGLSYLQLKRIFFFIKLSLSENAPLSYRFKILINVLKKFGYYSRYISHGVGIIDEGVSHIPFNFLSTDTNCVVKSIREELSCIDVVYLLNEEDEILIERLSQRGHSRLNFMEKEDFLNKNRIIERFVLENYNQYCSSFKIEVVRARSL